MSLLLLANVAQANAAGLIRDAEIEDLLSDYAGPIFRAASLSSQSPGHR
jgi:predicted Zn-dependent protease